MSFRRGRAAKPGRAASPRATRPHSRDQQLSGLPAPHRVAARAAACACPPRKDRCACADSTTDSHRVKGAAQFLDQLRAARVCISAVRRVKALRAATVDGGPQALPAASGQPATATGSSCAAKQCGKRRAEAARRSSGPRRWPPLATRDNATARRAVTSPAHLSCERGALQQTRRANA